MRRTSLATKCAGIRKNVRIFYEFTLDSPADFRHKEAQKETTATECVLLELLRSTVRGKITLAMSLPKFAHADKSKAYQYCRFCSTMIAARRFTWSKIRHYLAQFVNTAFERKEKQSFPQLMRQIING